MVLTWTVAAAVLVGALLHAGWNALIKSSSDKSLDTALLQLLGCALGLPLVLVVGWPAAASWPFLAGSTAIHLAYYAALSRAYHHGELGLAYPLMRGTAPLLVALATAATIGESPSALTWVGVAGISLGVLALGLSRQALASPRAVAFALANAVVIAAYTITDGLGVRASGSALQYVAALFALHGWPFVLLVLARRGRSFWPYARRRWPLATLGALASLASYGIALWAMTRAPVATIAALRETSVLFAALLGTWLLKESFTPQRAAATALIVAGVMALRLG
ncbi:EamA family transporter [Ramlibacter sp.]|uniref:EamA family transporter n=1 Tax=Ramlibacter sp. TaxID=1917967 RepID=UPI002BECD015|nr:EamA family transporter [Ramlibacter sp.]HWI82489.1 EamA family transporter [Ramlibacter sp.]